MTNSGTPDAALYRRVIDWDRRLAREGPFLAEQLALGPAASVLDLGCGTGEHDRWLAERTAHIVGVDQAPDMVAAARSAAAGHPALTYFEAPIEDLPNALTGPFDAAMCLGNTLVHLLDEGALRACFAGVAQRLRPGGRFLIQILNYQAIVGEQRRWFPPAFHADATSELVFLRFMDHAAPGFVDFESVVLRRTPGIPSELLQSRRSRLRAWTRDDLTPLLEQAIGTVVCFGGMRGEPFSEHASDLVLSATRR